IIGRGKCVVLWGLLGGVGVGVVYGGFFVMGFEQNQKNGVVFVFGFLCFLLGYCIWVCFRYYSGDWWLAPFLTV
ncbi:hypothetical protein V2J61_00230, partial [Pseudomonas aeruginosa]|uniref:hypothetical protein n=1 Tax=Pseudomonas aeruginosa TaxID=287 RepID=UPI002ECCA6F8|nr:hypothetical protein [Pseudomonas aeruginosa]